MLDEFQDWKEQEVGILKLNYSRDSNNKNLYD